MSYLDLLLELEKKSGECQAPYRQRCQKPSDTAFDPFGSTPPGVSKKITSPTSKAIEPRDSGQAKFSDTYGGVLTEPPKAPIWWQVIRDGKPLCIVMQPDGLTRDEALAAAKSKWPNSIIEVTR